MLTVQIKHVDGELHEEAVNGFTWHDPKAITWLELSVLQQTGSPLCACVSALGAIGQHDVTSHIANADFQTSGYSTIDRLAEAQRSMTAILDAPPAFQGTERVFTGPPDLLS
jgi:hypothetical protein